MRMQQLRHGHTLITYWIILIGLSHWTTVTVTSSDTRMTSEFVDGSVHGTKSVTDSLRVTSYELRPDLALLFDLYNINQTNPSNNQKWMGGDISTSIDLHTGQYLWLFGDTCVGYLTSPDSGQPITRKFRMMTSNSIGIYDAQTQSVTNYLPTVNGTVSQNGIFTPPSNCNGNGDCKYWCTAGVRINSTSNLYLACQTPSHESLASMFTTLLIIFNPNDPPLDWKYESMVLPMSGWDSGWSTAMTYNSVDENIYFIGQINSNVSSLDSGEYLSRIDELSIINQDWNNFEVWCSSQEWTTYDTCINENKLQNILPIPISYTESSLYYSPNLQLWLISLLDFSNSLWLASTPDITQPQIPWTTTFLCTLESPFVNSTEGLFNYAAKIHMELIEPSSTPGSDSLILSFNTNGQFSALAYDLTIYHPHFIQVNLTNSNVPLSEY